MKYARIVNNAAVDTRDTSPDGCFTPNIVEQFIEVPDTVEDGWTVENGKWSAPVIAPVIEPTPAPVVHPTVSAIRYYNLFTAPERIAIKGSADPLVKELFETLQYSLAANSDIDLNLKTVKDALDYLTALKLLAAGRAAAILTGVTQ